MNVVTIVPVYYNEKDINHKSGFGQCGIILTTSSLRVRVYAPPLEYRQALSCSLGSHWDHVVGNAVSSLKSLYIFEKLTSILYILSCKMELVMPSIHGIK